METTNRSITLRQIEMLTRIQAINVLKRCSKHAVVREEIKKEWIDPSDKVPNPPAHP